MPDPPFDPKAIEIAGFSQTLLKSERGGPTYLYEITLQLHDAFGTGFLVESLTLKARGFGMETQPQMEVIGLLLQAAMEAIYRDRTGSRPGGR